MSNECSVLIYKYKANNKYQKESSFLVTNQSLQIFILFSQYWCPLTLQIQFVDNDNNNRSRDIANSSLLRSN